MNHHDPTYIMHLRAGLSAVMEEAESLLKTNGCEPRVGSSAAREYGVIECAESIMSVCGISSVLLEYSAEHLSLLDKALVEPVEPLACLTCVRSMLEGSALIVWFTDPLIDGRERVARVFAHRYAGQEQQLSCARSNRAHEDECQRIVARREKIAVEAVEAGYAPILDRKGKTIGAGCVLPSATALIGTFLNSELFYRSLSAVAHGQNWAIIQLGFRNIGEPTISGGRRIHSLKKFVNVEAIWPVGVCGISAFGKALWSAGQYLGWDRQSLIDALERTFDKLQIGAPERFWRQSRLPTSRS